MLVAKLLPFHTTHNFHNRDNSIKRNIPFQYLTLRLFLAHLFYSPLHHLNKCPASKQ